MDSSTCLELALEGERLCKSGDCRAGVAFFEAALRAGTDDLRTLSAVYSQLGNAFFYLAEYDKAMEYHKLDLTVATTMGDRLGVAKASGNLGNTLKVMGKFKEAVICCERHLTISQELEDKVGEGRALYNLGNVYHAQGKHLGRVGPQEPGGFSEEVKHCLQKAVEYYAANLKLMEELGDRSAQGRACGNLGNTHYLLGNFSQAICYHNERLTIAKEFGDKAAERRAHSNLGNAHIFLGEFETAADHYKKTLQLAQELSDRAVEAQACYSLGNTYTLLRDYPMAIHYHLRHLAIAQELNDRVGEGRACWSLGNAYQATNNHEKALYYANRHLVISKEIGDQTGQAAAQMNLNDIRRALGLPLTTQEGSGANSEIARARNRRKSMEQMDLLKMTPDSKGVLQKLEGSPPEELSSPSCTPKKSPLKRLAKSGGISSHQSRLMNQSPQSPSGARLNSSYQSDQNTSVNDESGMDVDSFFELLSKFQSKRMDDQRCPLSLDPNKENKEPSSSSPKDDNSSRAPHPPPQAPPPQSSPSASPNANGGIVHLEGASSASNQNKEDLMELILGMQSRRMDEQRAALPNLPGLTNQKVLNSFPKPSTEDSSLPDDNFFDMLMRCQGSRLEDQRSTLPVDNRNVISSQAPTVPDDDFFALILRFQSSGRLEDQRSSLPRDTPQKIPFPLRLSASANEPNSPPSTAGTPTIPTATADTTTTASSSTVTSTVGVTSINSNNNVANNGCSSSSNSSSGLVSRLVKGKK
ncbi:G-protein-signaling modulator 2 [Armadillidium nasatum]|uniref:G-protein-signaling modulator 2 n=1 Tax=Armadillidium nasatum TaxID=96803 RepID=A0A5N5SSV8_9CRUS|nr:G-protein-signaling modulator 2 [Armadillidium nasatum]